MATTPGSNGLGVQQTAQQARLSSSTPGIPVRRLPPIPPEVKARFPSMHKWEADLEKWRQELVVSMGGTTID